MSSEEDNVIRVHFGAPGPGTTSDAPEGTGEDGRKLAAFSDLIDADTVMVTLDARRNGVRVPAQFLQNPQLHLNFCHGFHIPDFDYDGDGVRASLSFQGKNFFCDIPWKSVWMLRSHKGRPPILFPESLPEELKDLYENFQKLLDPEE